MSSSGSSSILQSSSTRGWLHGMGMKGEREKWEETVVDTSRSRIVRRANAGAAWSESGEVIRPKQSNERGSFRELLLSLFRTAGPRQVHLTNHLDIEFRSSLHYYHVITYSLEYSKSPGERDRGLSLFNKQHRPDNGHLYQPPQYCVSLTLLFHWKHSR
jgi:hypothetical protein